MRLRAFLLLVFVVGGALFGRAAFAVASYVNCSYLDVYASQGAVMLPASCPYDEFDPGREGWPIDRYWVAPFDAQYNVGTWFTAPAGQSFTCPMWGCSVSGEVTVLPAAYVDAAGGGGGASAAALTESTFVEYGTVFASGLLLVIGLLGISHGRGWS